MNINVLANDLPTPEIKKRLESNISFLSLVFRRMLAWLLVLWFKVYLWNNLHDMYQAPKIKYRIGCSNETNSCELGTQNGTTLIAKNHPAFFIFQTIDKVILWDFFHIKKLFLFRNFLTLTQQRSKINKHFFSSRGSVDDAAKFGTGWWFWWL